MSRATLARLTISTRPALRDHLHGAWWPSSTDVQRELPLMLQAAAQYVPTIVGVSLNRNEWPNAPLHFRALATGSPKITWYGLHEPHMAVLQCNSYRKVILLVVPPDTPVAVACVVIAMATTPGNSLGTRSALAAARSVAGTT